MLGEDQLFVGGVAAAVISCLGTWISCDKYPFLSKYYAFLGEKQYVWTLNLSMKLFSTKQFFGFKKIWFFFILNLVSGSGSNFV